MITANLRCDSASGKAHHSGKTSRASCDHTSAPDIGTPPIKGHCRLAQSPVLRRIETLFRIALRDQGENCAMASPTQNLTHLHQVLNFKISRRPFVNVLWQVRFDWLSKVIMECKLESFPVLIGKAVTVIAKPPS
jgi:hypothetical protein